jgi:hypothetical protein
VYLSQPLWLCRETRRCSEDGERVNQTALES